MAIHPPLDLQNRIYTARDDRRMIAEVMGFTRIFTDSDLLVSAATGMNITVAPGRSIISEAASLVGGQFLRAYEFYSDAAVGLTIAASDPTNPRVDLVIARIYDSAEIGSGPDQGTIEVIAGTAQSGASLTNFASWPLTAFNALPAAHVLAAVLVPAAVSSLSASDIRDRRVRYGGKSIVDAQETVASTTYALMPTPDRVPAIYVPPNGVLKVLFWAEFYNTVANAGKAAIFLEDVQLRGLSSGDLPTVLETAGVPTANLGRPLFSYSAGGLYQDTSSSVFNFQMSGVAGVPPAGGMAGMSEVSIMAPAGLYDVSVRVKSSSGQVGLGERKLWAWSIDPGGPHGGRF